MSGRSNQSGFTIIEVTLFLAISGLLFIIGFFGISARTRSVQLTDSMQSLNAQVKDVFSDVYTGVNTREANNFCNSSEVRLPGKADDCILMGYVMEFHYAGNPAKPNGEVTIHTMIGENLTQAEVDSANSLNTQLFRANIRSVAQSRYLIEWGTVFLGGNVVDLATTDDPRIANNNIGFIRLPRSSGVVAISYRAEDDITEGMQFPQMVMVGGTDMRDSIYCFRGANNERVSIEVSAQTTNNVSQLTFNDERCNEF